MNTLKISNLSVYYQIDKYNSLLALDSFNGEFKSGTISVVVGESGSGKTTLLKTIAGLLDYDGDILYNDKDFSEVDFEDRSLAYISQDIVLYPNLTIYDNIAFPLKGKKISKKELDEAVKEIANKFGIYHCLTRHPKQLSVGQRHRVALAKALIRKPEVVLLDEPFSSYDKGTKSEILPYLKDFVKDNNTIVILVTHNLSEANYLGDHIYSISEGKTILEGEKEEVIKRLNVADLHTYNPSNGYFSYSNDDFKPSDLPTKRRRQFLDILKNRWRTMLLFSVLVILFSLPLLAAIMFKDFKAISLNQSEVENDQLIINHLFFNILYVPCFGLLFFGFSLISRCLRNIIWGEGVLLKEDIKSGIKQNGLSYFLIGVFLGVIYFLSNIAIYFVNIDFVKFVPISIFVVFLLPVVFIQISFVTIYKNNLIGSFKNSIILLFKKPLFYYLLYLALLAPVIVLHLHYPNNLIKYALYVFIMFIYPILYLAWTLLNYSVYDENINKLRHQEIYKKGLNQID